MKRSIGRKIIHYFLFNCLVVISLNATAQELLKPIQRPVLLSGNFGELRATHFHAGIDIRTGGVEGLPVVCVKDGGVARVSVSPTGYGLALYIEHPDGTTTVYGHLRQFAPRIAAIVRELQYQQESFRIDENLKSYGLLFRQGDTIAYSGNTGSSGGPHLHFEIRDTRSERTLNPLNYYKIKDSRPPVVKMVYLYALSDEGGVELIKSLPVKAVGNGKYSAGTVVVPAGKIGVGVFAIDYMDDSWNKLGVYQLTLESAGKKMFQLKMDSCSFDQGCFINELKDFDRYKKGETVFRCFGNHQEAFLGVTTRGKGDIRIMKDSLLPVRIHIADINGNQTKVDLQLKGGTARKHKGVGEHILKYDEAHVLELPGCRVELAAGALYASIQQDLGVKTDSLSGNSIYILAGKDTPLFKKARLFITGNFDRQAIICEVAPSGYRSPLVTRRTDKGLEAQIGYLSRYTVAEDREAPVVTCLGQFPDRTLRFRVKDNLSGIATWRGEVNGKWCLFSYDPRIGILQCSTMEPVFERGKVNEVRMIVEDQAGNGKEVIVKIEK